MLSHLRFALRQLWKSPGFSAVAILTLALGIGANTAIFSAVYALMLKPLPFPEPERLVEIYNTYVKGGVPRAYAAISLLLLAVAALACWLPAQRATRVNPIDALRSE